MKGTRKLFSILTALALCLSLLPGTALAVGEQEDKSGGWVYPYIQTVPKQTATYAAGGGTITWEPELEEDTVVGGTLTLNNAVISSSTTGIHIPVPATIVLEGTNSISVTGSDSSNVDLAGIVVNTYTSQGDTPVREDLTIQGPGSLTITSSQFGIIADGALTIDGATVSVTTQADKHCINAENGDLTIRGSTVYAKENGGVTNFSGGLCSTTGSVLITDSKVTAISTSGFAINAYQGDVRFTDSDVAAIGNVPISYGEAPIIFRTNSEGIHFQISGGTLFAQNNSSDGRDIIYSPNHVIATDSAAIYYHGTTHYLIQSGDNIQYESCTYDESTGAITVGNGYVMGNVEWNDNILFPNISAKKSICGYNYDAASNSNKVGTITIPTGAEVIIPASGYLFSYSMVNNGTLTSRGYCDNYGTLTNNGTINNYGLFYNEANTQFNGNGTFNNLYYARNFPGSATSDSLDINGLILNYDNTVSPVKWEYVAHGNAQLLHSTNHIVGGTSSVFQPLRVLSDATFTIPENRTVDASNSNYSITWDTLGNYLFVDGKIVVNGTLKLPANPVQEKLDELLTHISGTGQILIGESMAYPVTVTGGTADKSFAKAGETVTLTPEAGQGEVFRGWTASPSVTITGNTFTMPGQAVAVTAQYDYTVTFDSQGGSAMESQTVESGGRAQEPETNPTREGYIFDGWYTDTDCEITYDFDCAVTAPLTLYAKWRMILPDPPAGEGNTQYELVMDEGVREVPTGLQGTYQTPEALESAMKVKITEVAADVPAENTAVYDVTLLVSQDGGTTWEKATAANFPSEGLTVTLPYPDGTNSSYVFTVVHMFTTTDFGKTPGNTETPAVTNTPAGIRFTVTGLSPISVGWKEPAGSSGSGGGGSTYAITVEPAEHGKVSSDRARAGSGSTVTLTVTPDSGYALDALSVTDSRDNEIELVEKGGGAYTFTMPSRAVTVRAAFISSACTGGADCPSRAFSDLDTSQWYHGAVDYVLRNGLMGGYGNGKFGPNDNLSRAQFAQVLHNREGRSVVNYLMYFVDVSGKEWYAEAVRWAVSEGIVSGYGNGMFGPDGNITREQLALMLWRYAGSPATAGGALEFTDADAVSEYAREALRWAVENGIVTGRDGDILDPQGQATRAEAAAMLMRYLGK